MSETTKSRKGKGKLEKYELLYEDALLRYRKELEQQPQQDTADASDLMGHYGRMMLARTDRRMVLQAQLQEAEASGTHVDSNKLSLADVTRGLMEFEQREMNDDVVHNNSYMDTLVSSIVEPLKETSLLNLQQPVSVDVDAFFDEYPHAARSKEDGDDSGDSDEEEFWSDGNDDHGNEANGKKSRRTNRNNSRSKAVAIGKVGPAVVDLTKPTVHSSATYSSSNRSNGTAGPNPYQQQQQQRHLQQDYSNGAPPPAQMQQRKHDTTQRRTTYPPPNGFDHAQRHQQRPASTWDDNTTQLNPFQTAREFARSNSSNVGGGGGGGGGDHNVHQRPPPPQQQQQYRQPYYPSEQSGQPPRSQQQQLDSHNPYNMQRSVDSANSSPAPPPVVIRDSLKRKFQPPKRVHKNDSETATQGMSTTSQPQVVKATRSGSKSAGNGGTVANDGTNGDDEEEELPEELKRYGKDLVQKIRDEIMDNTEPVTFNDIAGLEDVKQLVQEAVCWPMKRPDLFTGLRRAPKGLLLHGPPGTGKTLIGKAIAHESGATFFSISSSSLTSKWIGEGEKLVRTLFAVAAVEEPAVVFIDEIDSLLTQRKSDENEASRRIKTEFLVQLDGTGTSGQGRVLVIGATNRPQELDEAARRRFTKRMYVPLPKERDRETLLKVLLNTNQHQLTNAEIQTLAKDTDGFSGADLKSLSTDAAMGPIRELGARALEVDAGDVPPISYKHFRRALRGTKPSVAPSDIVHYVEWDKTYGSRRVEDEEDDEDE